MEYSHGNTGCISTQAGCRMGCLFCASTIGGLERNLEPSEMLDQILYSQRDAGKRISNIVLMGIGEPLDNFDNVIRFLRILNHPAGINIGARHITLSTCGIIDNIDKLGSYGIQLTLSVSLHAPDDETRSHLMPVNRDSGVDKLINTCQRYFAETGRRVSYEYAMIDGVNDTPFQAGLLAEKLRKTGSHLNLIMLNNVSERGFQPSDNVEAFTNILKQNGINYTIRRSLGGDIDAACGQLRSSFKKNK
jgi:23S rRNA (adenine2503-C2)-methyltransferase